MGIDSPVTLWYTAGVPVQVAAMKVRNEAGWLFSYAAALETLLTDNGPWTSSSRITKEELRCA